ncbi:Alpha-tocopherol transfer protein-like, partial [Araneus ventricosus]
MDSTSRTKTNMEILPFSINYLPEFVIRKCEEECKETPERKINSIQELRSLLLRNQIISGMNFHDDVLLQYLRRNKYRIDQCVKQIQNFVLLKRKDSLMFERLPDEYLSLSCLENIVTVLPKRCPDG